MFEGAFANPIHWIFAIIVLVLVFGANKLGDIGGALGKSVREFKDATQSGTEPSATAPAPSPESTAPAPPVQASLPPVPEYRPPASPAGMAAASDRQRRE